MHRVGGKPVGWSTGRPSDLLDFAWERPPKPPDLDGPWRIVRWRWTHEDIGQKPAKLALGVGRIWSGFGPTKILFSRSHMVHVVVRRRPEWLLLIFKIVIINCSYSVFTKKSRIHLRRIVKI